MKQESSGETKKVDWADILTERLTVRTLTEQELYRFLTDYLIELDNELSWVGVTPNEFRLANRTVLGFANHLKENFYHVSRN